MWSVSRTLASASFLLLVWAISVTSAEPASDSASPPASLIGTLDQLKTAAQSVLAQLDSRLEEIDTRLSARVTELSAQVSDLSGQLDSCRPSDELSARVGELYSRRDDYSQLDARLSTQLRDLSDRLDRSIETVISASQEVRKTTPRDCSDLPEGSPSGVYLLQPGLDGTVRVPGYCDMETDGGNWTVFQRRADVEPREDFFTGWTDYKDGFGELDKEFWWGLDNMRAMTSSRDRQYELRIDLEDFEGDKRHASYQNFRISSESDGYRLRAHSYTGDAGDSFTRHIGNRFSTKDNDQDTHAGGNCAEMFKGAWWYSNCLDSNLNGQYLSGQHSTDNVGVNWGAWRGAYHSLKTTTMKIRPTRKLSD